MLLLLLLLGVSKIIEFWFRIREVVERAKLDFYRHFVSLSLSHTLSPDRENLVSYLENCNNRPRQLLCRSDKLMVTRLIPVPIQKAYVATVNSLDYPLDDLSDLPHAGANFVKPAD